MTPEQEKKLNEVHAAIVGNPSLGYKGLAERVIELEDYKENDKRFKNRVAGGLAVGTPLFGMFWAWIQRKYFGL